MNAPTITPQLHIESLAYGGDGIAHLEDGRVVFVPSTTPGDIINAEIIREEKGFVRAHMADIVTPSKHRITPPCPYADLCGGCQWQHVAYHEQLYWKRQSLVDALSRIGKIEGAEALVGECVASPKQLHYRNKVEFGTTRVAGRLSLGFFASEKDAVTPIESCLLLPKKYAHAPKALQGALRYIEGNTNLGIERVGLRVSTRTSSAEVALWSEPGGFPRANAVKTLSSALPLTSIVRVLCKGESKKRKVSKVEVLNGQGFWRENLTGHDFMLSAPSFFQVNTPAAENLVSKTLEMLKIDGSDKVLDLYSGAGTFTLPLTDVAGEIVAVESMGSSVRDLRRNLENAQRYAEVIGGDTDRELDNLKHFDIAIVDPPRAGIAPTVPKKLSATGAKTLAYVSCNPTTLARDLKLFAKEGFTPLSVTPFDLFPQTYHVESVTLLSRTNS